MLLSSRDLKNESIFIWTVKQSSIPYLETCDVGHGESGVLYSAEWHDGDWLSRWETYVALVLHQGEKVVRKFGMDESLEPAV
ncbi:hypothetical protein TNCV_4366821 [Trichonephila clavipes]|nr:hypothetical protein TNCV_4366821 [Trichonephila clavipes]